MKAALRPRGGAQLTRSLILVMLAGAALTAQDKPDFSGRWVLERSEQSAPDIPRALSVRQSLVRTNVRGEPMKPFFKDIAVDREFESGTRSETYFIGVVGGFVSGLSAHGGAGGPSGHQRVDWDRNALVFESGQYTGDKPETGVWTEHRETWSLDTDGRLHVTLNTRSSRDVPKTATLIYRRS